MDLPEPGRPMREIKAVWDGALSVAPSEKWKDQTVTVVLVPEGAVTVTAMDATVQSEAPLR